MAKKVKSHKPKKFNGIAFIGETPDKKDENSGVAFGGAVGEKIFKPLLASAGISFEDSLVTYVVPYRPERNKFYIHEQRHPELIEEGISDMHNLINEYEPTIIVPLGAIALKYTTAIAGSIEAHRGSIYPSLGFDKEYKVIPTFDPLYLASRYEDTVMSAFDMKRIAEESKFPEIKLRNRKYVLRPSFELACGLLKKTLETERVGYDIETQKNGHINCLGFSLSPDFAFCIPFMCEHGDYWTIEEEREIWKLISEIMYSDKVQKVIHNFMFEGFMMEYYYDMEIRNVYDTMVASHVLYPELPNSLAFATSIFTKEPYYKEEGKGDRITRADWDEHYKYNCKDNAVTIEIAEAMMPMLISDELEHIFWEEMQSAFCAVRMELDGISVDTKIRTAGKNKLQDLQDKAKEELVKLIGRDINPGSYKQVQELIYDEMGLPKKYKKNAKGGQSVATDVDALGELGFRFGHRELELIIDYRKNQTAKSFYTYKLDSRDGKLRCSHNPTGQVGARWSTSKLLNGIGRNVQNFPKSAKGQIVASDGMLLMEIDLEQAESRIVALYSDCKRQLQIFENGEDIHAITASHLFPDKTIEQCGKGTVERYLGKTMDHSGNYGVGGLKLARKIYKETSKSEDTPTIKLEAGVVQGYLDGYHALYPEIKGKYWEDIKAELRGEGEGSGYARTLTNCFGRKRHFWSRLDDQNTLFEALNYKPQSIVAMIINKVINSAFINLYDQGVRPLVHTHDGCLFEIPKVDYMDYAEQINSYFDIPLHIGNHVAVIPAEAEIGESWGSMEGLKFI